MADTAILYVRMRLSQFPEDWKWRRCLASRLERAYRLKILSGNPRVQRMDGVRSGSWQGPSAASMGKPYLTALSFANFRTLLTGGIAVVRGADVRSRKSQPASSLVSNANSETAMAIRARSIKITSLTALISGCGGIFQRILLVCPLLLLFDELPCNDSKDFIYSFTVRRADLMATIPS